MTVLGSHSQGETGRAFSGVMMYKEKSQSSKPTFETRAWSQAKTQGCRELRPESASQRAGLALIVVPLLCPCCNMESQSWFLCYPFPSQSPPTGVWPCPRAHSAHSHPLISPTSCSPLTVSPPAAGSHSGTKAWTGLGSVPRERCGGTQRPHWPSGNTGQITGGHGDPLGGWPLGVRGVPEGQEQCCPKLRLVLTRASARSMASELDTGHCEGSQSTCGAGRGGQGQLSGALTHPDRTSPTLDPPHPPTPSLMGQGLHWLPTTPQK